MAEQKTEPQKPLLPDNVNLPLELRFQTSQSVKLFHFVRSLLFVVFWPPGFSLHTRRRKDGKDGPKPPLMSFVINTSIV